MQLANYLFFTTQCEAALAFYTACGLGRVTTLMRHGDGGIPIACETMRTRSPFLRCLVIRSIISVRTASACFFERSWLSAMSAARCLSVMVAGAAAFFAMLSGLLHGRGERARLRIRRVAAGLDDS